MTKPGTGSPQWVVVDEGWGRRAVDFATLSEPANCREYVAVHHMLGAGHGDRLLDAACGACAAGGAVRGGACGAALASALASARGADCAAIYPSPRVVAGARSRRPGA